MRSGRLRAFWYGVMKAKVAVERGVAESVEKGLDVAWEEMEGVREELVAEREREKQAAV